MLSTIKRLVKEFFSPSKNGSRMKFFFNKEKVSKSGESSRMAFGLEFERVEPNSANSYPEKNEC